jgi:hypothetical protein
MKSQIFPSSRIAVAILFAVLLFTSSALAGPPLICHSFAIGDAKSIPWISHDWNLTGSESYNTKNLAADTIAVLDSDSVVLVHMETLRRATLYARKDPVAAKELVTKLVARADSSANSGAAALAWFDLGYLAECYKQWIGKDEPNPAHGLDGYALVKKAMQLRGGDPQMDFAAALVTLNGPFGEHQDYVQKTIAGAKTDALLAHNLFAHFMGPQSETMADFISRTSNVKVAKQ